MSNVPTKAEYAKQLEKLKAEVFELVKKQKLHFSTDFRDVIVNQLEKLEADLSAAQSKLERVEQLNQLLIHAVNKAMAELDVTELRIPQSVLQHSAGLNFAVSATEAVVTRVAPQVVDANAAALLAGANGSVNDLQQVPDVVQEAAQPVVPAVN